MQGPTAAPRRHAAETREIDSNPACGADKPNSDSDSEPSTKVREPRSIESKNQAVAMIEEQCPLITRNRQPFKSCCNRRYAGSGDGTKAGPHRPYFRTSPFRLDVRL